MLKQELKERLNNINNYKSTKKGIVEEYKRAKEALLSIDLAEENAVLFELINELDKPQEDEEDSDLYEAETKRLERYILYVEKEINETKIAYKELEKLRNKQMAEHHERFNRNSVFGLLNNQKGRI